MPENQRYTSSNDDSASRSRRTAAGDNDSRAVRNRRDADKSDENRAVRSKNAASKKPQKKASSGKKRLHSKGARFSELMIIVIAVIGISFFLALFGLGVATDLFGLNQKDMEAEVTIPFGATTKQIAKILDKADIISHP